MNKRIIKKCLSLVLCFVLLNTAITPVLADDLNNYTEYVIYQDSDCKITAYETQSGDKVFLQYSDGKLVQKNVIYATDKDIIEQTFYNNNTISTSEIRISDYVSVTVTSVPSPAAARSTNMGIIRYRASVGGETLYYGLRCLVDTKIEQGTYTINSYIGPLLNLVTMIVGALNLPIFVAESFLGNLLVEIGISTVNGAIQSAVSANLSSQITTYTWTLIDTTSSAHTRNVYGHKYYVNHTGIHYGETYYDGYVPKDWGTQQLAVWFHNEMFPYSAFFVVGWE